MRQSRKQSDELLDREVRRILDRADRKKKPLGPPPLRRLVPCVRCTGQALCEVDDQEWTYHCLHCGEMWPVES